VNTFQKVILVIGAIAFAVVMWTSPKTFSLERGSRVDVGAAFVRGISVLVAFAVILFIMKTRKKE
jgi:hypothetical protein